MREVAMVIKGLVRGLVAAGLCLGLSSGSIHAALSQPVVAESPGLIMRVGQAISTKTSAFGRAVSDEVASMIIQMALIGLGALAVDYIITTWWPRFTPKQKIIFCTMVSWLGLSSAYYYSAMAASFMNKHTTLAPSASWFAVPKWRA
jgi:hypothetical protein